MKFFEHHFYQCAECFSQMNYEIIPQENGEHIIVYKHSKYGNMPCPQIDDSFVIKMEIKTV